MRVLVNAVSIREGGPLTVLSKLLPEMMRMRPTVEWIIAVNSHAGGEIEALGGCRIIRANIDATPFHLLHWYERALPKAARTMAVDAVFSVTNYLPRQSIPCPTLLLVQHAGHFSPLFERLEGARHGAFIGRALWRRKKNWVRESVIRADVLTVQSEALADAVALSGARKRDEIVVIPHGPGLVRHREEPLERQPRGCFRIGYISKWGVQKNFETLFRAIRHLKDEGEAVQLVLTLDEHSGPTGETLRLASTLGVMDMVENHGDVACDGTLEM